MNESSPLIALSNYEAVQVVSDAAKKASNSQVATVAKASGKKLLAQAKKYADAAANGRTGLRLLAFLGGGAIVIDSIFCILSNALSLHFIAVLIDVYALFIGIAAIVMESEPDVLPFTTGARSFFERYLGFTLSGTGRGIFYFVAGTLVISKDPSLRSDACGFFVMVVGLLYVINSISAARKMKELRSQSYSEKEIRAKFEKYDSNRDGQLDFDEFHKLLIDLELNIVRGEAETLFLRADRDELYGINLEEFIRFWEECDRF